MEQIHTKRYPAYKDSGVEWLGEIPEHWKVMSLGTLLELKSDKDHPDFNVLSVYREYGVIPKDSRADNHNATSLDTSNYKAVEPGDLVVNKMKAWQGSMGISGHKGIVSPAYITCKVTSEKVHSEYLHQLLRCRSYIGEYNRISYGVRVGQWDMHYEDFKKVPVLLPRKEEQTRIAEFLDRKTAQIGTAIAQKERLIELLKERRQILIHSAVIRGLNPDVAMKDSGVEWIGEIPVHWEVGRLGFYAFTIQTGPFGSQLHSHEYIENGTPVINPSHIINGKILPDEKQTISESMLNELRQHILTPGDIVFGRRGEMGRCAIVPEDSSIMICGTGSIKICLDKTRLYPEFMGHYLRTKGMKEWFSLNSVGSTMENLNSEILSKIPILKIPMTEQKEISTFIKTITAKIEIAITNQQTQIEKLKEYKSILINSAVTGKIQV
ncbi:MAG: restriction endonuclease subunit S [bacterium]|nr:restriction endonuclease subunit S [bacterium]